MSKMLGVALVLIACVPLLRAGATTPPPASLDELMQIIEKMQLRIVELEAKVQHLESALADLTPPDVSQIRASGATVMIITSLEQPEPDDEALREVASLEADARIEEKAARDDQEEANRYISRSRRADPTWNKTKDDEYDAKRNALLQRSSEHAKKAKDLRGQAARLQRKHDERGPIIRGWNGSRRVVLEMTTTLPASLRTLVTGDFITFKGAIRMSDATLEVWTASSVERSTRPTGFNDQQQNSPIP